MSISKINKELENILLNKEKKKKIGIFTIIIITFILFGIMVNLPILTIFFNVIVIIYIGFKWETLRHEKNTYTVYDEFVIFIKEMNSKLTSGVNFKESIYKVNLDAYKYIKNDIIFCQKIIRGLSNYEVMEIFFERLKNKKVDELKILILQKIKDHDYDFTYIVSQIEENFKTEKIVKDGLMNLKVILYGCLVILNSFIVLISIMFGSSFLFADQSYIYAMLSLFILISFRIFKIYSPRFNYEFIIMNTVLIILIDLVFILSDIYLKVPLVSIV